MKVVAIPGRYDGCYYYRCVLPGMFNGWFLPKVNGGVIDWNSVYHHAMDSDAVLFQRPHDIHRVEAMKLLKKKGKKIIFDNDDTYLPGKAVPMDKLTENSSKVLQHMNDMLYEAIQLSDLVITTTEFLADEYRSIHSNIAVIKNCIHPIEKERKVLNTTGKKRIGFFGSVLTNDDYLHVKDQIKELSKDYTIVILGLKNADGTHVKPYDEDVAFWEEIGPEWHNFVPMNEYYHKLNSLALDVAIIPRADNYFNRCKSNLKFLEASLLEIPVIAQGFTTGDSPYQGKEDAQHMRIVTHDDGWYDAVNEVLKDPIVTGYEYVLDNYSIKNNAHLWQKEIQKICE